MIWTLNMILTTMAIILMLTLGILRALSSSHGSINTFNLKSIKNKIGKEYKKARQRINACNMESNMSLGLIYVRRSKKER